MVLDHGYGEFASDLQTKWDIDKCGKRRSMNTAEQISIKENMVLVLIFFYIGAFSSGYHFTN